MTGNPTLPGHALAMNCLSDSKTQTIRRLVSLALALVFVTSVKGSHAKQIHDTLAADALEPTGSLDPNRLDGGISRVLHERLTNGLDVILALRKSTPIVGLSIAVRVPLTLDPADEPALSRLAAHLLPAADTPNLSATERTRLLVAADTWFDQPEVHAGTDELTLSLSVPPDALELALFVEADRMGFAAEALTQAGVDRASRRLIDARGNDAPEALDRQLNSAVFSQDHPLAKIATNDPQCAFDVETVRHHLKRYFQAGNATLVITGDIEPKVALQAVQRTFGRLSGAERVPLETPTQSAHAQKRVDAQGAHAEHTLLGWQSPRYPEMDDARLDVLAQVLTARIRAESGRFCRRAFAAQRSSLFGSKFVIGCEHGAEFDTAGLQIHLEAMLRDIANGAITSAETRLARDSHWTRIHDGLGTQQGLAHILSTQLASGNTALSVQDYFSPYVDVARVDLSEVVRRYLVRPADGLLAAHRTVKSDKAPTAKCVLNHAAVSAEVPKNPNGVDTAWFRPPRKARSGSIVLPKIHAERLPSNVVLRHLEHYGFPTIQTNLRFVQRDHDLDPQLALVAMYELVQGDGTSASLIERLWNDFAVMFAWCAESNALCMRLTGSRQRMEQAILTVRAALSAPHGVTLKLENAKKAASAHAMNSNEPLVDQLEFRVGSALMRQLDSRRLASRQARIDAVGSKQIADLWAAFANHAELDVAIMGPCNLMEARRIAAAVIPASWQRATTRARPSAVTAPRIWVLDDEQSSLVDIQMLWPIREKQGDIRAALALSGLSRAAKALGNVNAARPRNPTSQFTLDTRAFVETETLKATIDGIEVDRLETLLRELDGYFARLVERVDFPQLARMGTHDQQRGQLAWFTSTSYVMNLLDNWALSGSLGWYPIDNYDNLGLVSRERIAALAKSLTLDRATIVAKGPAVRLKEALRNVNHGEWIVVPPAVP